MFSEILPILLAHESKVHFSPYLDLKLGAFKWLTLLDMVAHTYNPCTGKLRQKNHKFKISLGYTESLFHIPILPPLLHKKEAGLVLPGPLKVKC